MVATLACVHFCTQVMPFPRLALWTSCFLFLEALPTCYASWTPVFSPHISPTSLIVLSSLWEGQHVPTSLQHRHWCVWPGFMSTAPSGPQTPTRRNSLLFPLLASESKAEHRAHTSWAPPRSVSNEAMTLFNIHNAMKRRFFLSPLYWGCWGSEKIKHLA